MKFVADKALALDNIFQPFALDKLFLYHLPAIYLRSIVTSDKMI